MQIEKTIKADVEVLCIKPKEIDNFWPLVEFLIAEALKFSGQYAEAKHIKELCKKNIMHLWIMFGKDEDGEDKVFGCCTTRFFENPNFKELQGLICTGKKMRLWFDKLVEKIETFAKLNNCKRVTALMRPGYKKIMGKYNWKIKHYEFQKELN
jgi:hypothetical protein|tara:strand:- start:6474 stop:6932 length:459 start_codon:yes stop_codon:yes gene_type:complete